MKNIDKQRVFSERFEEHIFKCEESEDELFKCLNSILEVMNVKKVSEAAKEEGISVQRFYKKYDKDIREVLGIKVYCCD